MIYLQLFYEFFKTGLFAIGGGLVTIPFLSEMGQKFGWFTKEELANMLAISESTPGPIGINMATYVGYKMGGFFGALASTLGMVLPSFVIIFLISLVFDRFLSLTVVSNAFRGIQACVVYLILSAGIKMFKGLKRSAAGMVILCLTVISMITLNIFAVKFSSVFYILISGFIGFILYLIGRARKEETK